MSGRNQLSFLRFQNRFWSDENAFGQGDARSLGSLAALAQYFADFTITPADDQAAAQSAADKAPADKASDASEAAIVFELVADEPTIVFDQDQPAAVNHTITYAPSFVPAVPAHAADPAPSAGQNDQAPAFAGAKPDFSSDAQQDVFAALHAAAAMDHPTIWAMGSIVLHGASRYTLASPDSAVGAGSTLTIDASGLGADKGARFDGSAETDGSFAFLGGAGNDVFTGGAKGDSFTGGLGADQLTGGAGSDTFIYHSASESTGASHDTLVGLNLAQDHIDLAGTVTGVDAGVSGTLSAASFDSNLASALGASALGAGHAALFTANAGDLSGHIFLVVDANGQAGYQGGADYVFDLGTTAPLDAVTAALFI
jgi:hypothetical protein